MQAGLRSPRSAAGARPGAVAARSRDGGRAFVVGMLIARLIAVFPDRRAIVGQLAVPTARAAASGLPGLTPCGSEIQLREIGGVVRQRRRRAMRLALHQMAQVGAEHAAGVRAAHGVAAAAMRVETSIARPRPGRSVGARRLQLVRRTRPAKSAGVSATTTKRHMGVLDAAIFGALAAIDAGLVAPPARSRWSGRGWCRSCRRAPGPRTNGSRRRRSA